MNAREFVEAHAASLWGDSRVGVNSTGAAAAVERAIELYTEICEAVPASGPSRPGDPTAICVCGARTMCQMRRDAHTAENIMPNYCAACGGAIVVRR